MLSLIHISGEKLHEEMITVTDALDTIDLGRYYAVSYTHLGAARRGGGLYHDFRGGGFRACRAGYSDGAGKCLSCP